MTQSEMIDLLNEAWEQAKREKDIVDDGCLSRAQIADLMHISLYQARKLMLYMIDNELATAEMAIRQTRWKHSRMTQVMRPKVE